MDNRYDWNAELIPYLSQFRCANQTTRVCDQINRPVVVVPQSLNLSGVDCSRCPFPANKQFSNGVEVVTYPPDAQYRADWLCRVAKWYKR